MLSGFFPRIMCKICNMTNIYLYDTHIHTVETSPCGRIPAAETVDYYAAHGYTGLVITDHLHREFLDIAAGEPDWKAVMERWLKGYRSAKKRGDEIGFDVILGAEMRFTDNNNDYLVYGIDEDWLFSHAYVICQTAREFFQKYHDEVLVMHAHPYRDGNQTVFEDAVHGIELINTNRRHENHTDWAAALCERHPEYFRQAGSDMHRPEDRCRAGIIVPERIRDSFEYAERIRSGQFGLYAPDFPEFVAADQKMRQA